jgi:hypothetical protein
MATPRIFLSSTCYDLNEIRDNLYSFIDGLGYIPVFSDKNDVFYHPDLHSHESCIKEIENCQIFILVIGGRFGGNYVYDTNRSIVNAEYQTAKKLNLPIFTFIKREVHEDHRVFIRNKKEKPEYYDKVIYPSIEKQETAEKLFDFIDEVRKSDKNNAYFTFEYSRDIREILVKQFAGLFYDFLWKRQKEEDENRTQELLSNLSLLGKKTEEIIENIYKKVDEKSAEAEIKKIDAIFNANKFWQLLGRKFNIGGQPTEERAIELSKVNKGDSFLDYLVSKGKFKIENYKSGTSTHKGLTLYDPIKYLPLESDTDDIEDGHLKTFKNLELYFKSFKELSEKERFQVLNNNA